MEQGDRVQVIKAHVPIMDNADKTRLRTWFPSSGWHSIPKNQSLNMVQHTILANADELRVGYDYEEV